MPRRTLAVCTCIASILLLSTATRSHAMPLTRRAISHLDSLCERLAEFGFGGAVAVVGADGPELVASYGWADRESGKRVEHSTRFDLGSLTKQFTAVAVMQLEGEGRLRTTDLISTILPNVPEEKRGITISHLLTHTSGLTRTAYTMGLDDNCSRGAFLAAVMQSECLFAPGERFSYSDVGYDLLAAIIEIVANERFEEFLVRHVFHPAGMQHTAHRSLMVNLTDHVALSYRGNLGEGLETETEGPSATSWFNRGSGGVCSTIADLILWEDALRDNRVLQGDLLDSLFTGHVNVGSSSYGYGWFIDHTESGARRVHHGGDIAGYKAVYLRYPDDGIAIIGLCNVLGWEPLLDDDLERVAFGDTRALPPPTQPLPISALEIYEATLESTGGARMVLWADDDNLVMGMLSQGAADLLMDPTDTLAVALHAHNDTILAMVAGFEDGDFSMLSRLLRERDLAAGLDRRIEGFWKSSTERMGPLEAYEVIATVPGQDGTMVTFLSLTRGGRTSVIRFIWRGDRVATMGTGVPFPSVVLTPTSTTSFALVDRRTLATGELSFPEGPGGDAQFHFIGPPGHVTHLAHSATPSPLPSRSIERRLVPLFLQRGADSGLAELARMMSQEPSRYDVGEDAINDLGYTLLHRGNAEAAVAVFRRTVELYPESSNAYDSFAEALLAAGDTASALTNYRRALDIDPDNNSAKAALDALTDHR